MSSEALPIAPARFAAALADLSLASLHLKVLELRNSIAHLDYSNEQLRPFANGTEASLGNSGGAGEPDADCVEAIAENEAVIARMEERVALVRAEVERRGASWSEFQSKDELERGAAAAADGGEEEEEEEGQTAAPPAVNGEGRAAPAAVATATHEAWRDGTFQTGTIRNGTVHMDSVPGVPERNGRGSGAAGGSLSDEELRRRVEEQLRGLGDDGDDDDGGDGGMHL